MSFAPEGRPFIALAGALAIPLWTLILMGRRPTWLLVAAALATLLLVFVAYFFRDPERRSDAQDRVVLSPADGRILSIEQVDEPLFIGGPARRITIFLSVFNVHVQRAPFPGVVGHRSYQPGGYAVAWHPKASEENEQASIGIETSAGRVLVRQIAGLIARRIVTYSQEGDTLTRGQRIGIIRFGSRVDLFVPLDWEIVTREGETVAGGLTPLARAVPSATKAEDLASTASPGGTP